MKVVVFIPARLASSRFPQKILTPINGLPMIAHVVQRAMALNIGECYVACCSEKVKTVVEEYGGKTILTDPELPSGTDRIYASLTTLPYKPDIIVNLQGDMPVFDPSIVLDIINVLKKNDNVDMTTPVTIIENNESVLNKNKVKVVFENMEIAKPGRAIYFSREAIPSGASRYYCHVGIYAYRYQSLQHFVNLPQSYLEKTEKLEQLRCLESGMKVWAVPVIGTALSVDVETDLEIVNCCLENTQDKKVRD